MIHVVAVITAKPRQAEESLKHFRANIPAVHGGKGASSTAPRSMPIRAAVPGKYVPHLPCDREVGVMDALKAHAAAPHNEGLRRENPGLVANRAVHILSPAA